MFTEFTFLILITPVILHEFDKSGLMQQIEISMQNTKLLAESCAKKFNATEADVENFLHHKAQISINGKCLVACILRGSGIISNGVVAKDTLINALKLYPSLDDDNNKMEQLVNDCKDVASTVLNVCVYAAVFNTCMDVNMKRTVKTRIDMLRSQPGMDMILRQAQERPPDVQRRSLSLSI